MILCVCPNPSVDSYAWLENFSTGNVNRINNLRTYPGGKATHVACALKELDIPCELMGIWAGKTGEYIRQECHDLNIPTSGIEIQGENRRCYTFRSIHSDLDSTELLEPGPTLTKKSWLDFLAIFKNKIKKVEVVVISGSCPFNAPEDAYLQLIEVCNRFSKKVIIDCSGVQLKNALNSSFYGIHINEHEIKNIQPENSVEATIEMLQNRVNLLALTLGEKGLNLITENRAIKANVRIQNIKSTVGSGDCLTAGIAAAVHLKLPLEDIARYGVSCGAANCINEDLGMLKKEDVLNLMTQVTLKKSVHVQ